MYTVEEVRFTREDTPTKYLNSKPSAWKLIQWKWIFVPYTDEKHVTHSGYLEDFNGVQATWEVPGD